MTCSALLAKVFFQYFILLNKVFFWSILHIWWSGVIYLIVCVRDKEWKCWDQGDASVAEGHQSKSIKGSTFSFSEVADVSEGLTTAPRDKVWDGADGLESQGGEREGGRWGRGGEIKNKRYKLRQWGMEGVCSSKTGRAKMC